MTEFDDHTIGSVNHVNLKQLTQFVSLLPKRIKPIKIVLLYPTATEYFSKRIFVNETAPDNIFNI